MTSPRRSSRSGSSGTLLAVFVLMLLAVAFLGLTAMIMPGAFGFLAVLLGLFLFVSLHYLLWGWWLGKPKPEDDEPTRHETTDSHAEPSE
jgi:threonine/homoserine/homoserine lactone efflux protein